MISCLIATYSFAQKQQDLFSLSNAKKYANYLYQSGDYQLAVQEYERITFLDSSDVEAKQRLLVGYRALEKYDLAINKIIDWELTKDSLFTEEYVELLILNNYLERSESYLSENSQFFPRENYVFYQVATSFLAYDIQRADSLLSQDTTLNTVVLNDFRALAIDAKGFRKKYMGLAVPMSIIIPGTGKIYAGQWKDGLFSLFLTGVSAWQAHRAFQQRGIGSTYGWIYSALTTGFYVGNIYGTVKSVRKYNNKFKHNIIHRAERITFTHF